MVSVLANGMVSICVKLICYNLYAISLCSDMGSLLDDVFTPGDSFNTTNRQAKQSVPNLVLPGIRME
jgi:hypothetical protein